MKQNKLYVAPQVDVIKIEPQGILCSSGGIETSGLDFNGTGMNFTRGDGEW